MEATAQARLATEETANPALYVLNWETINAPIPFNGREVIHTLRRPKNATTIGNRAGVSESAHFRKLIKAEEIVEGDVTRYKREEAEAFDWLWQRCVIKAVGYEKAGVEFPLTDENKVELMGIHKEIAIKAMTVYQTELLPEKTEETWNGGVYCVRVWQGRRKADDTYVGDFYLNFWSEAQRKNYRGSISGQSKREGKQRIDTFDVPLLETAKLYDSLIERADGVGVEEGDDEHKTVRPATRQDLVTHTQAFLKEAVIAEALLHWEQIAGN